jgi:GTP cyclohydrolase II
MPESLEALFTWLDGKPRPSARPLVTVSYAQSLDGSIAAPGCGRLRLSGSGSLRMTHRLRAAHDAIMVGIGTILADDPQLTVREVQGEDPRPIIVDTFLRTPPNARALRAGRPAIIAAGESTDGPAAAALLASGAEVRHLPTTASDLISLPALLALLESLNIRRLMVEGGARLITSFLDECLVDSVVITMCPSLIGGLQALHPLKRRPAGEFPRLIDTHSAIIGDDIVVWGKPDSVAP